jgi:hypothetical protein
MRLRGKGRCSIWRLTHDVVTRVFATLLILSACATPGSPDSPEGSRRFQYNHRLFTMELKKVEVFDDSLRLTLMYTNRQDRSASGELKAPPKTLSSDAAYIVDDRGKRLRASLSTLDGDFAGGLPR